MNSPTWHCRSPDGLAVAGTSQPWLYTSALEGRGKIAVGLTLDRAVATPACTAPPVIDGTLDDACWQAARPVPFAGNAHLLAPEAALFVCRDEHALYFAYSRDAALTDGRPVPFAAKHTGADAPCWEDDDFELFLTGPQRMYGAWFGVSCAGGRFDGKSLVFKQWPYGNRWNGQWQCAAKRDSKQWRAEIAIPMETLRKAGIEDVSRLALNCRAVNRSGHGLTEMFLADPILEFERCQGFLPLADKLPPEPPQRSFTVRLHFAETAAVAPGRRVFDVAVQGAALLDNFDIVRAAGGSNTALVKEFQDVQARDAILFELTPSAPGANTGLPPMVSGIEIVEKQ